MSSPLHNSFKNSFKNNSKRAAFIVVLLLVLYLLPNAVLRAKVLSSGNNIVMHYDDHKAMERAVSQVVPAGTGDQRAKRVMWLNGFACTKQTSTRLEFEKNDGWWPTHEGTAWVVEMGLHNGQISGTKVWIEPND